jgi:hypothetical protein
VSEVRGEIRDPPMDAWGWVLMTVVTLIWVGMFAALVYLASSRVATRR